MSTDTTVLIITTTTAAEKDARFIAETLVKDRLAACVQVEGPINSFYWWEDKLEKSLEWRCVIKTPAQHYHAVEKRIKELHPYKCPQIVAVTVASGSTEYLDWVTTVCFQNAKETMKIDNI